jgi:hypothetical protein
MWGRVEEITSKRIGCDFESVTKYWLSNKKFKYLDYCCTMVYLEDSKWSRLSKCAVDRYEGGGPVLCKNVVRLEDYPKARRGRKAGALVGRTGKDRIKGAKCAVVNVPQSGSSPWTMLYK